MVKSDVYTDYEETIIHEILTNKNKAAVKYIGDSRFFLTKEYNHIFNVILRLDGKGIELTFDKVITDINDDNIHEEYKKDIIDNI